MENEREILRLVRELEWNWLWLAKFLVLKTTGSFFLD